MKTCTIQPNQNDFKPLDGWKYPAILALLIGLSGVFNGIADTLKDHYSVSIFPKEGETLLGKGPIFWNPVISWKNKYKDWDGGDKQPAFIGAKTWLVSLTDAWHLAKAAQNALVRLALVLAVAMLVRLHEKRWLNLLLYFAAWVGLGLVFSGGFTLMYDWILK